jgi:hypothetical protein
MSAAAAKFKLATPSLLSILATLHTVSAQLRTAVLQLLLQTELVWCRSCSRQQAAVTVSVILIMCWRARPENKSHRPTDRHMTDSMTDVTWLTWLSMADVWPTHDRCCPVFTAAHSGGA